ncbi:MAG: IclR family transcriptional regulator [Actinobacteria bacterium]|nr:IclR family transcriptional regulator [Actinomycetota bacterium]
MVSPAKSKKSSGTQAVDRALAVLDCLVQAQGALGVSAIARQVGLSVSTAHRLLGALMAGGYVSQDGLSGQYYLGRAAIVLGQSAQRYRGLDLALAVLEHLGQETGESVNLGVRDGMVALVVLRVESSQALRFDQPVGSKVVLHASSMGKALLAFSQDMGQEVKALGSLAQITPHTITDAALLRKELEATRDRGYSVDNEESMLGVRCVGAPVLDRSGRARAAVTIQAPAVRVSPERRLELAKLVMESASQIARVLPAHRPM